MQPRIISSISTLCRCPPDNTDNNNSNCASATKPNNNNINTPVSNTIHVNAAGLTDDNWHSDSENKKENQKRLLIYRND